MAVSGAMSDWLEGQLLSHIFGSGTYTKPSVIAVALTSDVPIDADSGNLLIGKEILNAGAYARQTLNPSASNWLDPMEAGSGQTRNLSAITFPEATANWGWVSGVAILDSATYGVGNVLFFGTLTTPKLVGNADQFRFKAADLKISLD